jgi:hypothetical protein
MPIGHRNKQSFVFVGDSVENELMCVVEDGDVDIDGRCRRGEEDRKVQYSNETHGCMYLGGYRVSALMREYLAAQ